MPYYKIDWLSLSHGKLIRHYIYNYFTRSYVRQGRVSLFVYGFLVKIRTKGAVGVYMRC